MRGPCRRLLKKALLRGEIDAFHERNGSGWLWIAAGGLWNSPEKLTVAANSQTNLFHGTAGVQKPSASAGWPALWLPVSSAGWHEEIGGQNLARRRNDLVPSLYGAKFSSAVLPDIHREDGAKKAMSRAVAGNEGSTKERRPVVAVSALVEGILAAVKKKKGGEVKRLIQELQGHPDVPSTAMMNHAMRFVRKNWPEQVEVLFDIMERRKIPMDEVTYGCILQARCATKSSLQVFWVLEALCGPRSKVKPNNIMFNIVLCKAAMSRNLRVFDQSLDLMRKLGLEPDVATYNEMIKVAGLSEDAKLVKKHWKDVIERWREPPLPLHYTRVVALARARDIPEAIKALAEMEQHMRAFGWSSPRERLSGIIPPVKEKPNTKEAWRASAEARRSSGGGSDVEMQAKPGLGAVRGVLTDAKDRSFGHGSSMVVRAGVGEDRGGPPLYWSRENDDPYLDSQLQQCYHSVMSAVVGFGNLALVKELFLELSNLGLFRALDHYPYTILMRGCAKAGNLEEAAKLRQIMKLRHVPPSMYTHAAWVEANCRAGRLDVAEEEIMNVLPTIGTDIRARKAAAVLFNMAIHYAVQEADSDRAVRLTKTMHEANILPDTVTYSALFVFTAAFSSDRLVERNLARLISLEKSMIQTGLKHTAQSLHSFIWALARMKKVTLMMAKIREARAFRDWAQRSVLSTITYNTAAHAALKAKNMEAVTELLDMMHEDGLSRTNAIDNMLINQCSHGDADLASALRIVKAMQQAGRTPDLITFNSLIKVACHAGQIADALALLDRMTAEGIQPDRSSFNTILASAAYHGRLDLAEHVAEDMHRKEVDPDSFSCWSVVSAYITQERYDEAVQALEVLSARMLAARRACSSAEAELQVSDAVEEAGVVSMHIALERLKRQAQKEMAEASQGRVEDNGHGKWSLTDVVRRGCYIQENSLDPLLPDSQTRESEGSVREGGGGARLLATSPPEATKQLFWRMVHGWGGDREAEATLAARAAAVVQGRMYGEALVSPENEWSRRVAKQYDLSRGQTSQAKSSSHVSL